ncbi:MFS transporter [Longispora fulva]|uniref:EmrB/QacA subfamily drug resistance transporter n=1 Tax=Longispora fulva TaxID=619741 RepID=A0A8J7GPY2_9ACTN|nr:MFS transporter [Longispora fulva]MBG6134746.1 EmrB/QacA subfamily drug resistance transporter [Longispora fulva]GIG61957.1 MFS transporter [Longispora fulva]
MNPPPLIRQHLPRWVVVAIACVSSFMVVMDSSIVNVALPAMRADLRLSAGQQQWVVDAYLLTLGGFILLAARAGDLYGRRLTLQTGLVLFTLSSLAGGLATGAPALLAARAVQGVGAAALATSTLSVIMAATHGNTPARQRALSLWAAASSSAAALGVLIGGALTQQAGWRWVMFVNAPVGIALIVAVSVCLLPTARAGRARLDVPGAVTVTLGVSALLYGIAHPGWPLALGVGLIAVFLAIEACGSHPLVRLGVFRLPNVAIGNVVVACLGAALTTSLYFVSLVLQQVVGYDALRTGLAMAPMGVAIAVAAIGSRRLIAAGVRRLPLYGGLTGAVGLAWLSRIPAGAEFTVDVLGPSLLIGIGLGFMIMSATSAATSGIPAADAGLAAGLLNMARQVGGAVGVAALAAVADTVARGDGGGSALVAQLHGFQAALLAGAGISAVAAVVSVLLRREG